MAQTKRKRRSKHRGNAAGTVEARGRTGRPPSPEERKRQARDKAKAERLSKPPTWSGSFKRSLLAAGGMFVVLLIIGGGGKHTNRLVGAAFFAIVALLLYVPASHYLELFLFRRRAKQSGIAKR